MLVIWFHSYLVKYESIVNPSVLFRSWFFNQ
uniref:Uncharacterized protein n=1 Tax=Arundo donax TaxID=35708 RepID=A0A0A9BYL0_ARUDO